MKSTRYFVREPRNRYGDLLCQHSKHGPHWEVRDSATLVKTERLPFHEVPAIIAPRLTFAKAHETARAMNAQDVIDQAFMINL